MYVDFLFFLFFLFFFFMFLRDWPTENSANYNGISSAFTVRSYSTYLSNTFELYTFN